MKGTFDDLSLAELDELIRLQHKDPLGWLLSQVGGWHVGCINAVNHAAKIDEADGRGFIGRRLHHIPMTREDVPAYELTDEGIAHLREVCGEKVAMYAEKSRAWYRASAAKHRT